MSAAPTQPKVLQIHPTRRCNLRCLHCYSSSGPDASDEIEADRLLDALSDARVEGYTVAGFSGGEPLMYRQLPTLVTHASSCGFYTTVTSNGMLLDKERLTALRGGLDLLAISLDGPRESHNKMRNSPRAFDVMVRRLSGVRSSGLQFGFIFTLTQWNVHELNSVAEFAVDQGARLLVVHPLELFGRARERLATSRPDGRELAIGLIEVVRLQQRFEGQLLLQLDVFDRQLLLREPDFVYAGPAGDDSVDRRLADVVTPLVIEPDGIVVPIEYGFPRQFALGDVAKERLSSMARRWKRNSYAGFRDHCVAVHRQVIENATEGRLLNWYEQVALGQDDGDYPRGQNQMSQRLPLRGHLR